MHSCPVCDSACSCGGDIDDLDLGDDEAQDSCVCCVDDEDGDDEDGDDEDAA